MSGPAATDGTNGSSPDGPAPDGVGPGGVGPGGPAPGGPAVGGPVPSGREGHIPGAKRPGVLRRLYRGETKFDFVGRRRWWYLISGLVIIAGLVSLGVRGLNFGIDFRGGTSWEVQAPGISAAKARSVLTPIGLGGSTIQVLGSRTLEVQSDLYNLTAAHRSALETKVSSVLAGLAHVPVGAVSLTDVGPTWGSQITDKALLALIVFFVAITAYISVRFEWKMAIAALVAVFHDILVTLGIYALSGFQVTPDTIIAFLTILGYSLYDTIVVFDRVADNAKGLGSTGRMSYSSVVNLSMNQTLSRSINTSLVAIIPTLSVLVLGAYVLGALSLQYFGLALVIGLTSGAYSSLFIASPLLASLKEREPRYATIRQRLASRGEDMMMLTPLAAARGLAGEVGQGVSRRKAKGRAGSSNAGTGLLVPGAGRSAAAGASTGRPSGGGREMATASRVRAGGSEPAELGDGQAGEGAAPGSRLRSGSFGSGVRAGSGQAALAPGTPRSGASAGQARGGSGAGGSQRTAGGGAPRPRKKKRRH